MSFPRAQIKRFNEESGGCGPPSTKYNPKIDRGSGKAISFDGYSGRTADSKSDDGFAIPITPRRSRKNVKSDCSSRESSAEGSIHKLNSASSKSSDLDKISSKTPKPSAEEEFLKSQLIVAKAQRDEYQQHIQELNGHIDELNVEITNLKIEINDREEDKDALERKMSQLKDESETEMKELQTQIKDHEQRESELGTQLETLQAENENLSQMVKCMLEELKSAQEQHERELKTKEELLCTVKNEISEAQSCVNVKNDEILSLNLELEALRNRMSEDREMMSQELQQANETAKREIDTLRANSEKEMKAKDEAIFANYKKLCEMTEENQKLLKLREDVLALQDTIEDFKSKYSHSQEELQHHKTHLNDALAQKRAITEEYKLLGEQIIELKSNHAIETEDFRRIVENQRNEVSHLTEENQKLEASSCKLEREMEEQRLQWKQEKDEFLAETEKLKKSNENLRDEQEQLLMEISSIKNEKEQIAQVKEGVVSSLTCELSEVKVLLVEKEDKITEMSLAMETLRKQMSEERDALAKEMKQLKEDADRELSTVKDNLEKEVQTKLEELNGKDKLIGEITTENQKLHKLQQEVVELEETLSEMECKNASLEMEIQRSDSRLKTLQERNDHLAEINESLGKQMIEIENLKTVLEEKVVQLEAEKRGLEDIQTGLEKDLEEFESKTTLELQVLQQIIEKQGEEITTFKNENLLLTNANTALQQKNDQMVMQLQGEAQKLEILQKSHECQVKDLEKQISNLESQTSSLKIENGDLKQEMKCVEQELDSLQEQHAEELKTKEELLCNAKNEIFEIQSSLQEKSNEIVELERSRSQVKEQFVQLQQEKEAFERSLESYRSEMRREFEKKKVSDFQELEQQVENQAEEISLLKKGNLTLVSTNATLEHEMEELRQQYDELSGKYAQLIGHGNHRQKIHHLVNLKNELSALQKKYDALQLAYSRVLAESHLLKKQLPKDSGGSRFDRSQAFKHHLKDNNLPDDEMANRSDMRQTFVVMKSTPTPTKVQVKPETMKRSGQGMAFQIDFENKEN